MVESQYLTLKWLPSFGLAVVSIITDSATGMNWDWYCALNHPPWDNKANFPTHFFFLIGMVLNIGIGISSYAVWKEEGLERAAVPLGLYGTQLVLQWAYLPLLMGCKSVGWSLVDISLATGITAVTTVLFKKVNERTFALMVPYALFLSLANFHTVALYSFNREKKFVRSRNEQEEQTSTPRN